MKNFSHASRQQPHARFAFFVPVAAFALAGCFGNDDLRRLKHVETGLLEDLPRIEIPSGSLKQWRLKLDEENPGVKGECNYTGYLGDSVTVSDDAPTGTGLYTNTSMGGTHTVESLVSNGVLLSLDTVAWQGDTLTHYRAEFDCRY